MPTQSPRQTGILLGITVAAAGAAAVAPILARWLDRRTRTSRPPMQLEPLRTFSPTEFSRAIDVALRDPSGRRVVPLISAGIYLAHRLEDPSISAPEAAELRRAIEKLGGQQVTDLLNRALASDASLLDGELRQLLGDSSLPIHNDRVKSALQLAVV